MSSATNGSRSTSWEPLRLAAVVVAVEGVSALVLAALELGTTASQRVVLGWTTTLFFGLYGAALLVCAWGLWGRRGWSRAPVVLTQLIQLGVAWSFAGSPTMWIAVLLAIGAVGVLVAVFLPSSTAALVGEEP